MKNTIIDIDPTLLLEPDRIFNADESGFSLDAQSGKVLSFLGCKNVYQISNDNRTQLTVLICANASGSFIHPLIIYPGKVFRGFQPEDVFNDSLIAKSINGWINTELFVLWIEKAFIPQTRQHKKPIILFVDGHKSHQSLKASKLCQENDIILYCLPAHASHLVQPLDVGYFSVIKAKWTEAVRQRSMTENVTKRSFAGIFKTVYDEVNIKPTLMPNAFRKAGLFPFDVNAIDKTRLIPSDPTSTVTSISESLPVQTNQELDTQSRPSENFETFLMDMSTETSVTSSSGEDSILTKLVLLTSQIGEETATLYVRRLSEGYNLDIDQQYILWKSYFTRIDTELKKKPREKVHLQQQQVAESPFMFPNVRIGRGKGKVHPGKNNDPLVSGKDFIENLERQEAQKVEELRKKEERKVNMQKKREEKAKIEEEKKRQREEKKKQLEIKIREIEANKLKRKLEKQCQQNVRGSKTKKQKKAAPQRNESDDDTSVSGTVSFADDDSLGDVLQTDLEIRNLDLDLLELGFVLPQVFVQKICRHHLPPPPQSSHHHLPPQSSHHHRPPQSSHHHLPPQSSHHHLPPPATKEQPPPPTTTEQPPPPATTEQPPPPNTTEQPPPPTTTELPPPPTTTEQPPHEAYREIDKHIFPFLNLI